MSAYENNPRRADGGRKGKGFEPLDPNDPQTQVIQAELDQAVTIYVRTFFVDSEEVRQEHVTAIYPLWRRRYPEVGEGRRADAFQRFLTGGKTRRR